MRDLIDRQAAIDAFYIQADDDEWWTGTVQDMKEFLKGLPSAEPRRGRWIYGESEEGHDGYFCSQCGNFVPWIYKEFDIDFIKEFKFCPSCGADMRGEDDEQ